MNKYIHTRKISSRYSREDFTLRKAQGSNSMSVFELDMGNDNLNHFLAFSNLEFLIIDIITNTSNCNAVAVGFSIKINAIHLLKNRKSSKKTELKR